MTRRAIRPHSGPSREDPLGLTALEPAAGIPLWPRLAGMTYEALIVVAIVFLASLPFVLVHALLAGDETIRITGAARILLQAYLFVVVGVYFVWCWRRGQTLPMRTWRIRIVGEDQAAVTASAAIRRYVCAAATLGLGLISVTWAAKHPASLLGWLGLIPALLDLAWPLVDRDRQFLHDRLAGTRLVRLAAPK